MMPDQVIRTRLHLTIGGLAAATMLLFLLDRPATVPPRHPLRDLPLTLGDWQGTDLPITQRILNIAGVSDYISRKYEDSRGRESFVYIGYYTSQHAGEQIHSPRNCLPGAGWEILAKRRVAIDTPRQGRISVNDFLVSNGLEQELILYWYQTRGRAIPSEYQAKFWMLADALTRHRTDGALVRIAIPMQRSEADARSSGVFLIRELNRNLQEFVPD